MSAYWLFLSLVAIAYAAWLSFRAYRALLRLPRKSILAFLFFSAVATVVAQKPPAHMPRSLPVSDTVTDGDIERGYALVETFEDVGCSFAMPTNATIVGNWHKRGTFGEWLRLELGGFEFPMGINGALYSSFSVFNDGKIRPTPRDIAHEISAVGVPMLAMQGASRFWTMDSDDGSKLLTWENFFLNADTNAPVNAQIRLCPGGDFTARSNEVARQYRRINAHDIDGDGLANEIDPMPRHYDGDFFGTSPEWRELECAGIGNSNAYYFAEFSATGSLGVARIDVVCDGTSNLGDMTVIARSGQTCRVPLLIGADYEIVSDLPFEAFSLSDTNASAVAHSDRRFHVSYPLRFSFMRIDGDAPPLLRGAPPPEEDEGGAKTNIWRLDVRPVDPSIEILSVTGACCNTWVDDFDNRFCWECKNACHCLPYEPELLRFKIAWDGRTNEFNYALFCPCVDNPDFGPDIGEPTDDNGVVVGVAFSNKVIVTEASYTNRPDDVRSHYSAYSFLCGCAAGGLYGGVIDVEVSNMEKLYVLSPGKIPNMETIPPGDMTSFDVAFFGFSESDSVGDVVATITFYENTTGRVITQSATTTVARVELEPQIDRTNARNRHVAGIGEKIICRVHPRDVPWNVIAVGNGTITNENNNTIYKCPFGAESGGSMKFTIMDSVDYTPVFEVIEPTGVRVGSAREKAFAAAVSNEAGWVGMDLDLYLEPDYVSFEGLYCQEVPETSEGIAPTGYFTNEVFSAIWHHTVERGAGVWLPIRNDNMMFQDEAKCGEWLPSGWSDGTITWRIPVAIGEIGDDGSYRQVYELSTPYYQTFSMNSNGVLRVSKLGCWAERSPDGTRSRSQNVMEAVVVE